MSGALEGIYTPGVVDPGLPVANPTSPFWHIKPHEHANTQSPWPQGAVDIVVIGSGITGMSLVRSLLNQAPHHPRIALFEARSLCSGATARNGGHCKTMTFAMWEERKRSFGIEEAIRISEFEHSHLEAMHAAIVSDDVDCDLVLTEGVEAYYDKKSFEAAVRALEDMRTHAPHLAAKHTVYRDAAAVQQKYKVSKRCIGAIGIPAASMWPYKWITSLLGRFVDDGKLNLQTNTAVVDIVDRDNDDFAVVRTNRGDIKARHVIHATNAWLGHLVHELRPYISPVRANIVHYGATEDHKSPLGLESRYSLWMRYGDKDYDYLIQREAGDVVVGRANTGRKATSDDSATDLSPLAHLRGFSGESLLEALPDAAKYISHTWSGIVGFSQDAVPFAGRLPFPGRKHQWVCGGYHATGMIKAFRTAELVAGMVLGVPCDASYPRSLLVTDQRIQALRRSLDAGSHPVFVHDRPRI